MSSLDEVAQFTLSVTNNTIESTGFGEQAIVGGTQVGPAAGSTTEYAQQADLLTAGYTAFCPEYIAAGVICAQKPRPAKFKVIKLTQPPAMMADVGGVGATPPASTTHKFVVKGCKADGTQIPDTEISYTSDSSPTEAELATGLAADFTSKMGGTTLTASNVANQCRVVAPAGAWFRIELRSLDGTLKYGPEKSGLNLLTLAMVGANPSPTVATQLTTAQGQDDDYFGLNCPYQSINVEQDISAWAEQLFKIYEASCCDTDISAHVLAGATDIAALVKTAARQNTSIDYHEKPDEFLDAAWMSRWLPMVPGKDDSANKNLTGPTPSNLTPTQKANIKAKKANYYVNVGGLGRTRIGYVGSGFFKELVRGIYFLAARLQEEIAAFEFSNDKIELSDNGIGQYEAIYRRTLVRYQSTAKTPNLLLSFDVQMPAFADIPLSDRDDGIVSGVVISGVMSVAGKTAKFALNLTR